MRFWALILLLTLTIGCVRAAQNNQMPQSDTDINPPAEETPAPPAYEEPIIQEKEQEPPKPAARIHKVWIWQETGDCLWNLAKKYYGDPWLWKEIYLANKDKIKDPRVIFPKQELVIPEKESLESKK